MGRPILILFSSFLVCLLTLSYFLYRPVNLFSDSFYAPKGFHKLTEGELRALAYLNGWKGKLLTIEIAAGAAAVPMAGHLVCASGLWCLNREIGEGEQFWVGIFIGLSVMVGLALCSYMAFTCYALRRHWDWIQTHQPLPEARILAKYAKGREVGKWDHLYGTEFSEEMDRALEGRPGRAFWRVALQMLGGGVAFLALLDLVRGRVVPGREWGAAIFLMGGLLVFWLASRLLRDTDG